MFEEIKLDQDLRWAFGFVEKTLTQSAFITLYFSQPEARLLIEDMTNQAAQSASDPRGGVKNVRAAVTGMDDPRIPAQIKTEQKKMIGKGMAVILTMSAFQNVAEEIAEKNLAASIQEHSKGNHVGFEESFARLKSARLMVGFFQEALEILGRVGPEIFRRNDDAVIAYITPAIDMGLSKK